MYEIFCATLLFSIIIYFAAIPVIAAYNSDGERMGWTYYKVIIGESLIFALFLAFSLEGKCIDLFRSI